MFMCIICICACVYTYRHIFPCTLTDPLMVHSPSSLALRTRLQLEGKEKEMRELLALMFSK